MTPELMNILREIIIGAISVGGVLTLIGMKMRHSHLRDTRAAAAPRQEVERLADTVDNLHAELGLLREDFRALNERVDFTERLLERPKTEA